MILNILKWVLVTIGFTVVREIVYAKPLLKKQNKIAEI